LSRFKTYRPSLNLKFDNLGIFKSLKLGIYLKKKLIYLKLNFTPNILSYYAFIIFISIGRSVFCTKYGHGDKNLEVFILLFLCLTVNTKTKIMQYKLWPVLDDLSVKVVFLL